MLNTKPIVIHQMEGDPYRFLEGDLQITLTDRERANTQRFNAAVRHVMVLYTPKELLKIAESHHIGLPQRLVTALTNGKDRAASTNKKQLILLAHLVLMVINPLDTLNVVKTAIAIDQQDCPSKWRIVYQDALACANKAYTVRDYYALAKYYNEYKTKICHLTMLYIKKVLNSVQAHKEVNAKNTIKYPWAYETIRVTYPRNQREAMQLKRHYDGDEIATNHLFASLVALTDNLNAVDLIELLRVVNPFKARHVIECDLLEILDKSGKTFSPKNYLRYIEQIDCMANQFSEPNVQKHFKRLMQGKFAKRFILQNADKQHLKDLMVLPWCTSFIKETLTMMLPYCKTMPFNHNVFELMVRLYLSNVDINNHPNWSQILTLLREDITIGEALPIRNGAYRILANGFFCKRCAICADNQAERLHNDFKDYLKLDVNNGFLFAKSAKNVADCPTKERLFNEIVKYYQHPSHRVYPLVCNTLAESEEGMALRHVFTQLHQNETRAAQQRLRNIAIHLMLIAQGFFNNDQIDRLLDKIMRYHQGDLPAYFFTALAVLARNNTNKAVYVLQQCWNKTIKVKGYRKKLNKSLMTLSESTSESPWKGSCQTEEAEAMQPLFNEAHFTFLASWWKNKNPVKPNPETLIILSHLLALRVAPNNLDALFQLGKMLNNPSIAVYLKQDFIHCCKKVQYQLFQQYIDALHHVNNEKSGGQYALNQLGLLLSNELNPTRREGLNRIYSRAKCILNDKTRSRETHNLTANIVLRIVQFVINPDDSNQDALNRVLQDKNSRLNLGEKILRGIAIILSAVTGIGLVFAIPYGLSTIKKYQKSQLLEKTDLFVNQHAKAASVA